MPRSCAPVFGNIPSSSAARPDGELSAEGHGRLLIVADDVLWHANNSLGILDYAAIAVAVLALVFTVASFWWLNARKGSIRATQPRAYAFGGSGAQLRLRFPFALFNTGAKALIVGDLRVVLDGEPGRGG